MGQISGGHYRARTRRPVSVLLEGRRVSYVYKDRSRPPEWGAFKRRAPTRLLVPFYAAAWALEWAAYELGRSSVVEVLEYLPDVSE